MAKRFYINQYSASESNALFVIEIWDADFAGSAFALDGGFELTYNGSDADDIDFPLIASNANIVVHVTSDDTDFETFLTELAGSDEERFTVRIYRDSEIFWLGQIPTDLVEFPDQYYTYDVTITALCGIARLKNIPYDNDGVPFTGRDTIINHVLNMINKLSLPLVEINTPNSIIETLTTWYETSCSFVGRSPLEFTDLAYDAFQKYDDYYVIESSNCYDALEQICRALRLRLFQFGGKFWLKQITDLYSLYYYGYRQDGVFTASSTINSRVTISADNRSNGLFRRLPAIRTITSEYEFKQGINNGNLLPPNISEATNYDLDYIAGGSGEKILISGTFTLRIQENTPDDRLMFVKIAFKVNVGTYYLTGSVNDDTLSWSTTSTDVAYYTVGPFKQIDNIKIIPISIRTPDIPAEGDGTFMMSVYRIEDDEANLMTPATDTGLFLYAYNNSFILKLNYEDGLISDGSQRLISTNTTDGTTPIASRVIVDLPKYTIGDGPRLYSAGRLKIWNGTTWVNSELWTAPGAGNFPIAELRLRKIAANAKATRELYEFELLDPFKPHQDLVFNSEQYMFLSGSFNADSDRWQLLAMKMTGDYTNINISDLEEAEGNAGGSGSSSGGYVSVNSHARLHSVTNALDHAAAAAADYNKALGSNATTGALEWFEKFIGYWKRTLTVVSPLTDTDTLAAAAAMLGNVSKGDYIDIDSSGNLRFIGGATVWEDVRVAAGNATKAATNQPTFTGWVGGLKVEAFSPSSMNEMFFDVQLPHSYKEGSIIYPHIHWTPLASAGSAQRVRWGLEYSWGNNGETAASTTTIYTATVSPSENFVGYRRYISPFAGITGTGKQISSMLSCRIFRDATNAIDDFTGNAGLLEIDFHIEMDSFGSNEEYTK